MLQESMRATIEKYSMLQAGDRVLIALSGGPDSVALTHALLGLRDEMHLTLGAFHLNHLLRGSDSDGDEQFVRELAKKWEIECVTERLDVASYAEERSLSLETAAREIRYQRLREYAGRKGFNRIALAHQADDQTETVLLNLLRGAGTKGLTGIPPVRGSIIRPLLEVSRGEIMDYLKENDLIWREDATNEQPLFRRNKIRLELLPYLRKEYNPSVDKALRQTADILREEEDLLRQISQDAFGRLMKKGSEEAGRKAIVLPVSGLLELPLAVLRRVLRLSWQELTGQEHDLDYGQTDLICRELRKAADDRTITVCPGNVRVSVCRGQLIWRFAERRKDRPDGEPGFCYELKIPGEVMIPETGQKIIAEEVSVLPEKIACDEAFIVYDPARGPLCVRSRVPGDRFRPSGAAGSKKLKNFLIDRKIPREERDKLLLVCQGKDILWIAGLRVAETAKAAKETKETEKEKIVLRLRVGKMTDRTEQEDDRIDGVGQ